MIIKDKYLVSNLFGSWDFLGKDEFRKLSNYSIDRNSSLFSRLHEKGILADEKNFDELIASYKRLNNNLFNDTSHHVAVITTRDNLAEDKNRSDTLKETDMNHEVALRVLKYLFDVNTPSVTLELQGGEPLLNWEILAFLVEHAHKFNKGNKILRIILTTNFSLLNDKKMKFLSGFNVDILLSLDCSDDHKTIVDHVLKFKKAYKNKITLLPILNRDTFKYFKEIIDKCHEWGIHEVDFRPANKINCVSGNGEEHSYSSEDYCRFYINSMNYILEKNKKGFDISETTAKAILKKLLNKEDAGCAELMSPCGAGRSMIVTMPNGDVYPCNEAKKAGQEMFKLGNLLKENYSDLIKKDSLLHLLEASSSNLWDYNSAFSPWIGTCPVVDYSTERNVIPKIRCSFLHKIYTCLFGYFFKKMLENKNNTIIFKHWIK